MTAEFVLDLDEGMLEYFRDLTNVLVERCGISRPEEDLAVLDACAMTRPPGRRSSDQLDATVIHEEEARADLVTFMDGLYAAAEAELTEVVADLSSGDFGERLRATGDNDNVTDVDDFIQYRAWRVAGRELVTGVRQSDTDTPVMIVVVLREPAVKAEEVEDDWL
ncbi:hypothetical protein [Streptomyces thinghirensis]|uniref:DUF2004 domain-containing protein n=1 Tax=Streptomyces thinghirensis TaxID=551547 RepID=A0ABP9TB55_9ACTN